MKIGCEIMDLVFSIYIGFPILSLKTKSIKHIQRKSEHMKTFTFIKITDSCRVAGSFH